MATDFDEPSSRALQFVKYLAKLRRSPVRVVHVIELTDGCSSFSVKQTSAERALREIAHELRLAGIRETATLISAGRAPEAIRRTAVHHRAELLVLGMREGSRSEEAAMGPTVSDLLQHSICPVCTVGSIAPPSTSPAPDAPLIITDNASGSFDAVLPAWPAVQQEKQFRVVLPPIGDRRLAIFPDPQGRNSAVRPIAFADAPGTLMKEVRKSRAPCILLSFQAGGYLDSLERGSLARSIIREAPCPVMTIRASSDGEA